MIARDFWTVTTLSLIHESFLGENMHASHDNSADAHDPVRENEDEDKDDALAHMFTVNNSRRVCLSTPFDTFISLAQFALIDKGRVLLHRPHHNLHLLYLKDQY